MNATARFTALIIFLCSASFLFATHNRAGEITYRFTATNTISVVINTYTKTSSVQADRDSLQISWGDGTTDIVARTTDSILPNDVKYNLYPATHTYANIPASGFTIISMSDPNRNAGIINITGDGSSENVLFYIEDTIWFAGQANNNGPVMLYPPLDYAYVGDTFFYNGAAYDVEADSMTFELGIPLQAQGIVVPGYIDPSLIIPGPNDNLTLDRLTGELVWAVPQETGIYNIAIVIHEYRFGTVMSTLERDMQIIVLTDTTRPSYFHGSFTDTVITPGTTLALSYTGLADAADIDSLSAYSGIMMLPGSNASFSSVTLASVVSGTLTWTPGPNQYKQRETRIVVVRDQQQSMNPSVNIKAFRVTVVDTNNTATAIRDIPNTQNIKIYPVPAELTLYASITLANQNTIITDIVGRTWLTKISGNEIDISGLPAGIYFLASEYRGATFVRRFIKE